MSAGDYMTLFLALSFVVVGFLCGATSIGGILLIPAIQYSTGMPLPLASGTVLCSFFFTAAWGTWLHWKGGSLQKEIVLPQCIGAMIFGFFGALQNATIKNLTFGYTFPKKWLNKAKIDNLRLYCNIQNLYTFTKYSGYDPEVGASTQDSTGLTYGLDNGRYPSPTMYSFGLNITF